jgi:hypothetical protein
MAEPINWSTLSRGDLWDGDKIRVQVTDIGEADFVELQLKTEPNGDMVEGCAHFRPTQQVLRRDLDARR